MFDKSNNKIFLISSDKKSRQYEIDGIKGNNTKIFKDLNWEPKKIWRILLKKWLVLKSMKFIIIINFIKIII